MKKLFFWAAICLLTASCSNESDVNKSDEQQYAQVSVNVKGISVSVDEFPDTHTTTRGETKEAASYTDVAAIDLAFFDSDGTVKYTFTQYRDDTLTYETFGKFTCQLLFGTYNMVVIARGGKQTDGFTLTSPTEASYSGDFARETFAATAEVVVDKTDALDISTTLQRIITKLIVSSTDKLPTAATKIRTTYSAGSKSFNPTTGYALDDEGFSVTNTAHSSSWKLMIGSYAFLSDTEKNIDIKLEVLDKNDNVLNTKTIEGVPFKRNRITTLSGALFTADTSTFSMQLSTDWETGKTISF